MSKLKLFAAAAAVAAVTAGTAPAAIAQNLGTVTKANRAQLNVYDANGAPLGQVKAPSSSCRSRSSDTARATASGSSRAPAWSTCAAST